MSRVIEIPRSPRVPRRYKWTVEQCAHRQRVADGMDAGRTQKEIALDMGLSPGRINALWLQVQRLRRNFGGYTRYVVWVLDIGIRAPDGSYLLPSDDAQRNELNNAP